MESLFIYMCDAAVERCNRASLRLDVIIAPPGYPTPAQSPKRWGMQFVEPTERMAF